MFPLLESSKSTTKKSTQKYVLKHNVLKLNVSVAPTCFKYFKDTQQLIVGDRKGFITCYDID